MAQDNSIAYIDLSNKKTIKEEITPELRKNYMGGIGINTKILYDSEAMYHDALSDKNVLIFGVGPAVGTGLIAGNRCTITAKSPLTDIYGDSNIGGDFTWRMRAVGIDHLVFTGKAETPVYLHIDKAGEIHILDATDIWGALTNQVTDILTERHGKNCEVACIGPAGENLVRYACVAMSKTHFAGRMGMGCVMGSKNLKAIVIEYKKCSPPVANPEKLKQIRDIWLKSCKRSGLTQMGKLFATLFLVEANDKGRSLPVRNFKTGTDERAKNIYPTPFIVDHQVKKKPCYACPIGCSKVYEVREGKYKGEKGERIEFGAVASVGSLVGIFDWPSIIHLKLLTDYVGLDTMEFGGVVGVLMELSERGIIKKEELDGREVKFGNVEDVEYLIHKTVKREGIGNLIAEGPYRFAKAFNAEEYAFCVNGSLAGPQSSRRLVRSLAYLTSTRGGDHLKSFAFTMQNGGFATAKHIFKIDHPEKKLAIPERIGLVLWWHENYKYIVDALEVCLFAIQVLPSMGVGYYRDFADIMNAMFNLEMKSEEALDIAERIYQLQNSFNVNCGLSLESYQWPVRKKDPDIDERFIQATTIKVRDADGMLPEYFRFRGLTSDGKPTVERFKELGLDEYIEKAGAVHGENVKTMNDLLQEFVLNPHFTPIDKLKAILSSAIVGHLLNLKHKKDSKQYLKQKALNNNNT
jgi:aldehyde:ferredoxin oxidoreductase